MPDEQKKARARISRNIKATDAELEAFIGRIEKVVLKAVNRIQSQLGSTSVDNIPDLLRTAGTIDSLKSAMYELGLEAEIASIERVFAREFENVRDMLESVTGRDDILTEYDAAVVRQMINFNIDAVTSQIDGYADRLKRQMLNAQIASQPIDFNQVAEETLGRTVAQVKTDVITSTSGMNQSITFDKAEELGFEYFIYLGPLDKVTRPFCEARVGRVFSKKEIEGWPEQQGLDSSIYLGGYNCRHQLEPVEGPDDN